jgi:hypothetical protein
MNDHARARALRGRLSSAAAMVNISVERSLILPVSGYTVVSVLRYRRQAKMTGNPRITSQIKRAGPYSAKNNTIPSAVSDALR